MSTSTVRPEPRIVNHFEVVATSSGLVMGDFKWAVLNGIAVVHDGLSRHEAEVMARAFNLHLDGFRKMIGLERMGYEQLNLVLPPMVLAGLASKATPAQQKETKETKGARKAA